MCEDYRNEAKQKHYEWTETGWRSWTNVDFEGLTKREGECENVAN